MSGSDSNPAMIYSGSSSDESTRDVFRSRVNTAIQSLTHSTGIFYGSNQQSTSETTRTLRPRAPQSSKSSSSGGERLNSDDSDLDPDHKPEGVLSSDSDMFPSDESNTPKVTRQRGKARSKVAVVRRGSHRTSRGTRGVRGKARGCPTSVPASGSLEPIDSQLSSSTGRGQTRGGRGRCRSSRSTARGRGRGRGCHTSVPAPGSLEPIDSHPSVSTDMSQPSSSRAKGSSHGS